MLSLLVLVQVIFLSQLHLFLHINQEVNAEFPDAQHKERLVKQYYAVVNQGYHLALLNDEVVGLS